MKRWTFRSVARLRDDPNRKHSKIFLTYSKQCLIKVSSTRENLPKKIVSPHVVSCQMKNVVQETESRKNAPTALGKDFI